MNSDQGNQRYNAHNIEKFLTARKRGKNKADTRGLLQNRQADLKPRSHKLSAQQPEQ